MLDDTPLPLVLEPVLLHRPLPPLHAARDQLGPRPNIVSRSISRGPASPRRRLERVLPVGSHVVRPAGHEEWRQLPEELHVEVVVCGDGALRSRRGGQEEVVAEGPRVRVREAGGVVLLEGGHGLEGIREGVWGGEHDGVEVGDVGSVVVECGFDLDLWLRRVVRVLLKVVLVLVLMLMLVLVLRLLAVLMMGLSVVNRAIEGTVTWDSRTMELMK